jgi:drug/metabolite transporter (DMT)-like permease
MSLDTDHPRARLAGPALALAAGPAAKAVIEAGLTPLETVWLRLAGAALVLVPLTWLIAGPGLRALVRNRPGYVVTYGVLSIAGVQICYFIAISRLPVGIALLLEYLAPALVIVWMVLVTRVRPPREAFAGAVLAAIGIAIVVEVWSGLQLDALGLVAGVGAAICQASFFLLSDSSEDIDPLPLAAAGTVVGAVLTAVIARPWNLPWSALAGRGDVAGTELPVLLLVGWIVLVSTVLAYLTGIYAVRFLSAPVASVIATVEVVVAALVAWVVLGERLTTIQLLGGLVVLVGAMLAQRAAPGTADALPGDHPGPAPGPHPSRPSHPRSVPHREGVYQEDFR